MVTSPGAADLRLFPLFARLAGIDQGKISFVNVKLAAARADAAEG